MTEEKLRHGTGEIFDPKKPTPNPRGPQPKIVGANEIQIAPPTVLDKSTKQEHPEPEIHYHEEVVTVKEHVRSKPKRKDEPEVRVRGMSAEEKERWKNAKAGKDE